MLIIIISHVHLESLPSCFWLGRKNAPKKSHCSSVVSIFSVPLAGRDLLHSLASFPGVLKTSCGFLLSPQQNEKLIGERTILHPSWKTFWRQISQPDCKHLQISFYSIKKGKAPAFWLFILTFWLWGRKKNDASSMSYLYGLISILRANRREQAGCGIPDKVVKQPVSGWWRRVFVAILCRTLK